MQQHKTEQAKATLHTSKIAPQISVEHEVTSLVQNFFSFHPAHTVVDLLTSMLTDHVCKPNEEQDADCELSYSLSYLQDASLKSNQLVTLLVKLNSLINEKKA